MSTGVEDWPMDDTDFATERDCLRSIRTIATSPAKVRDSLHCDTVPILTLNSRIVTPLLHPVSSGQPYVRRRRMSSPTQWSCETESVN